MVYVFFVKSSLWVDYIPTTLDVRSVPKCTPKAFGIRFEITTLKGCPEKMFGPRGKRL